MIHQLIEFGIENVNCIYEFAPVALPWWDRQNDTVIDFETYLIDDNIIGLSCCFVPALDGVVERILVFNAIFDVENESLTEETLLARGLVNYLGIAEKLQYSEETNAFSTNSYQQSSEILAKILSFIKDKNDVVILEN